MRDFPVADLYALAVFLIVWLFYQPLLHFIGRGRGMNRDMSVIRRAWMEAMVRRENRFMGRQSDRPCAQLGQLLRLDQSAGDRGGDRRPVWRRADVEGDQRVFAARTLDAAPVRHQTCGHRICARARPPGFYLGDPPAELFPRIIGAIPEAAGPAKDAYGEAAAAVLDPALSAFSSGVRGYYSRWLRRRG